MTQGAFDDHGRLGSGLAAAGGLATAVGVLALVGFGVGGADRVELGLLTLCQGLVLVTLGLHLRRGAGTRRVLRFVNAGVGVALALPPAFGTVSVPAALVMLAVGALLLVGAVAVLDLGWRTLAALAVVLTPIAALHSLVVDPFWRVAVPWTPTIALVLTLALAGRPIDGAGWALRVLLSPVALVTFLLVGLLSVGLIGVVVVGGPLLGLTILGMATALVRGRDLLKAA